MLNQQLMRNRLEQEKSPYLLQHADNPVDWYPWGEAAFRRAREEDKPIFLSIGYSTCHWCHVMAHESFEDADVARLLNAHFIAVKVDREERPDVDAVYMNVCQAMTGSGGWPLTIIMTPEAQPFFAGTYLPKTSRYGTTGLIELLETVVDSWCSDRSELLATGQEMVQALAEEERRRVQPGQPSDAFLARGCALYQRRFDQRWGGFGPAPKFPTAHHLLFLLRYGAHTEDEAVTSMALFTLQQMYRGGIFDHIGGGFSRYSTDMRWLAPHFEKMLYDNALLAEAYVAAWQQTGLPLYRAIACRTLDYVLRELTNEQGAFTCAQDADSEGVEGKYYLFTPEEVLAQLGKETGTLFNRRYDITDEGNFDGENIPNLLDNPDYAATPPWLDEARARLYAYRRQRMALHHDDKVLSSWNGLMIIALAHTGYRLHQDDYLSAAQRAQTFLNRHLRTDNGRLLLRWREGEVRYDGQLDDYAFCTLGLLALYEATWDAGYLEQALDTARWLLRLFADPQGGGFFLTACDSEVLISRPKEVYDGALPSGNAAAALLLNRLALLTGEEEWRRHADRQLSYLTGALADYPAGSGYGLLVVLEALHPAPTLVCVTAEEALCSDAQALLRSHQKPLCVLVKTPANADQLAALAPFTASYPLPDHGESYYLCRDGACTAPTTSLEALHALLQQA